MRYFDLVNAGHWHGVYEAGKLRWSGDDIGLQTFLFNLMVKVPVQLTSKKNVNADWWHSPQEDFPEDYSDVVFEGEQWVA